MRPQMAIPLPHLSRKMFTNRHDLVVAKVGVFEQAAHRLVAQIVPAQIGELGPLHDGAERVPMARGVSIDRTLCFAIPSFLSGSNDLKALTARLLTGTRRGGRFWCAEGRRGDMGRRDAAAQRSGRRARPGVSPSRWRF